MSTGVARALPPFYPSDADQGIAVQVRGGPKIGWLGEDINAPHEGATTQVMLRPAWHRKDADRACCTRSQRQRAHFDDKLGVQGVGLCGGCRLPSRIVAQLRAQSRARVSIEKSVVGGHQLQVA